MKLSLRGEYALRAMITLGDHYSDQVVPIRIISERQKIPKRFLEQILNDLKSGGFVESKRGIAGGYRLARAPEELMIAEVIRYLGGGLEAAARSGRGGARSAAPMDAAQTAIRSMMREAANAMMKVLEQTTLADLCERARQARARQTTVLDYTI
jgi:Rrf2 family transcriptional regulator, cysteine metabolism repressor